MTLALAAQRHSRGFLPRPFGERGADAQVLSFPGPGGVL